MSILTRALLIVCIVFAIPLTAYRGIAKTMHAKDLQVELRSYSKTKQAAVNGVDKFVVVAISLVRDADVTCFTGLPWETSETSDLLYLSLIKGIIGKKLTAHAIS